mmetsp:Transcript_49049/g.158466  ORF Transcript_49049/g.158466 Transcript_49049/m.158466 type:complete len:210 (+) Transcript_49049:129-758(+)
MSTHSYGGCCCCWCWCCQDPQILTLLIDLCAKCTRSPQRFLTMLVQFRTARTHIQSAAHSLLWPCHFLQNAARPSRPKAHTHAPTARTSGPRSHETHQFPTGPQTRKSGHLNVLDVLLAKFLLAPADLSIGTIVSEQFSMKPSLLQDFSSLVGTLAQGSKSVSLYSCIAELALLSLTAQPLGDEAYPIPDLVHTGSRRRPRHRFPAAAI